MTVNRYTRIFGQFYENQIKFNLDLVYTLKWMVKNNLIWDRIVPLGYVANKCLKLSEFDGLWPLESTKIVRFSHVVSIVSRRKVSENVNF